MSLLSLLRNQIIRLEMLVKEQMRNVVTGIILVAKAGEGK